MTLKCKFLITSVNKKTEKTEILGAGLNVITAKGLQYLAGAENFKQSGMPDNFNPYINAIFLGTGTQAENVSDDGLQNESIVLPTSNYNSLSLNNSTFVTMPVFLPAGTYTELAVGYIDPATNTKHYYNRAVLETPLVIDAAFYNTYSEIQISYTFDLAVNTGYSRLSSVDISGIQYNINVITDVLSPWNDYRPLGLLETDKGAILCGTLYRSTLTGSIKRLSPTPDNVAVYELSAKNDNATAMALQWFGVRIGNIRHDVIITNSTNKETNLVLQPGETVKLQLELHYLPRYSTDFKLANVDNQEGTALLPYNLTSSSLYLNTTTLKSAYTITAENGTRTDLDITSLVLDPITKFVPETARESTPEYNKVNNSLALLTGLNTEIYKLFCNDYLTREHFVKAYIGTTSGIATFGIVSSTYNATLTNPSNSATGKGLILNSKPSTANKIAVYDALTDVVKTYDIFKTADNQDAVIIPDDTLNHDVANVLAVKYVNSANTAQKGIWSVLNRVGNTNAYNATYTLAPITVDQTLARLPATTPIIGFKYDRINHILSGTVLNANKVKIINVGNVSEEWEFDVTPNSDFEIDLTTTILSTMETYKFVAWNSVSGNSDGPVFNGYMSVGIAPISDAVYDEANLKITFTRPGTYVKYAVLRRWNIDFYKIELTDGTNTLNLQSALDHDGQWELIAEDENNGESTPFYIFGEKPDDMPAKPTASVPTLTPTLVTSNTYHTSQIGFYVDPTTETDWWTGLTWFGSINNVTATVTFKGIKQRYTTGNQIVIFLAFEISNSEGSFKFELDTTSGTATYGQWSTIGSYYKSSATIKLWHDWIAYDGNLNSETYYTSRKDANKIYGTGNGYHQVTDIEQGYIRRAIGIILNTNDTDVIGGACPINFDNELTADNTAPPTLAQHLSYMHVVFGIALHYYGDNGRILRSHADLYSVIINGQLASIIDANTVTIGDQVYATTITWGNPDGVAYILDFSTWTFVRTDRSDHEDDPAYQDIVDDIQLCYNGRANPAYESYWAFQSDKNNNRSFDVNVRQLSWSSYWQSIKGYIRPYYKSNALVNLSPSDLAYPTQTSQVLPFDFDLSKLDPGNELEFYLQGEVATLQTIVVPQQYPSWDNETDSNGNTPDVVGIYKAGSNLYTDNLVSIDNGMLYRYQTNSNINSLPYPDRYNIFKGESFVLNQNRELFEYYRNKLSNASDYLTYDQLIGALYINRYGSAAIDSRLIASELASKKLLVPVMVTTTILDALKYAITNNNTSPMVGVYGNSPTVSAQDYLTGINNAGLSNVDKIVEVSYTETIIGHREYTLSDVTYTGYTLFTHLGTSTTYQEVSANLIKVFSVDTALFGLNFYKLNDRYSSFNGLDATNIFFPICSGNANLNKAVSKALHGEDRNYVETTDTKFFTSSGLFDLQYARSINATGKHFILIATPASLVSYNTSFLTDYTDNYFFEALEHSEQVAHALSIVQDKPIVGRWYALEFIEIDLSKTDEELSALLDIVRIEFVNRNMSAARIGISVDGFDKNITTTTTDFGISKYTNKPLSPNATKAYMVETSDATLVRRKLVSENYELTEVTVGTGVSTSKGNWFISKGLKVNEKASNNLYWEQFKVTVKTKYVNSVSVFDSSRIAPQTVAVGDATAQFLNLQSRGYDMSAFTFTPEMFDPRIYPANDFYGNMTTFANVLFKVLALLKQTYTLASGMSEFIPLACNGKLMKVVPVTNHTWKYNYWSAGDYVDDKVIAKIVDDETGEHIANLHVIIQGYSSYGTYIEIVTTTPDLYLFTMVLKAVNTEMQSLLTQFQYSGLGLIYNGIYMIGGFTRVYDYSNPPAIDPVVINLTANIGTSITPSKFASANGDTQIPFPAWDLVSTTEEF